MNMTHTKSLAAAVFALATSAFVSVGSTAPSQPAPVPGPGGVAAAIKTFLDRQEAGQSALPLLVDSRHEIELSFDGDKIEQVKKDKESVPSFLDVGMLGKPIAARTAKQFDTLVGKHVASKKAEERVLKHEIGAIRANCMSEACSLAIVEFTRIYTVGGGKQMHVPMRATALVRYEQAEGTNFRIYHWHASRAR